MDIPKYLSFEKDEEFVSWKNFVEFVGNHTSKYLTHEDRENMFLTLYQYERGYGADNFEAEAKDEFYGPFLADVRENISELVVLDNSNFEWEKYLGKFGKRGPRTNFSEVIARDTLMMEKANQTYQDLKNGVIEYEEKFESNFENAAMNIARFLDDRDHQNYMV